MKNGVSPLIAWVLLVGFAVVMGAFIFTWTKGTLTDLRIGESQEKELYCDGVSFSVDYLCTSGDNSDELHANITNKGNYDITTMTISLDFDEDYLGPGYCYRDLDILGITFEVGKSYYTYDDFEAPLVYLDSLLVGAGGDEPSDNWCVQGRTFNNEELVYLGLVPWITIEDESFPCSNKEVVINGKDEPSVDKDRAFLNVECVISQEE